MNTVRDDLRTWLRVRSQVDWEGAADSLSGPIRGRGDGIALFAGARPRPADPLRAERLRAAWRLAHMDAASGHRLDFDRLAAWQRRILGRQGVAFRTLPAFAKGGDERYGLTAETPDLFNAYLMQATSSHSTVPVAARAARVYLDVSFFHPFEDGNGRSALIALGFVLAREDIVLDEVGPLPIPRYADDPLGACSLARLVHALALATARRAHRSPALSPARR